MDTFKYYHGRSIGNPIEKPDENTVIQIAERIFSAKTPRVSIYLHPEPSADNDNIISAVAENSRRRYRRTAKTPANVVKNTNGTGRLVGCRWFRTAASSKIETSPYVLFTIRLRIVWSRHLSSRILSKITFFPRQSLPSWSQCALGSTT